MIGTGRTTATISLAGTSETAAEFASADVVGRDATDRRCVAVGSVDYAAVMAVGALAPTATRRQIAHPSTVMNIADCLEKQLYCKISYVVTPVF